MVVSLIGLLGVGIAMVDLRALGARLGLIVPLAPDNRIPTFREVQRGEVSSTSEPPGAQQLQILRALVMRNCMQRQREFSRADGVAVDDGLMRAHCVLSANATLEQRDMDAIGLREIPYYRRGN